MYQAAGGETPITQYSCMLPIALPAGDVQVDGVHLLAERQLRVFQPRARLDGEVGLAVGALTGVFSGCIRCRFPS